MKKKSIIHIAFLVEALLLVILGFIARTSTIDIHLHDTYIVIYSRLICFALASVMFVYALIYFFTQRSLLISIFSWLHFWGTTASMCLIFFYLPTETDIPVVRRYIDMSLWQKFNWPVTLGIKVFLIANAFLVVNLIGGLVKRIKRRHDTATVR
jgi:hypothetical protein